MKNKIKNLKDSDAKKLLTGFMDIYLEKGFGVMNKTEIEVLLYHTFKENGLLEGECFKDSFELRISESKARKLIYESQIKYANRNDEELNLYLRTAIGNSLTHAVFSKKGKEIRFVIEDKYLRVAMNAKLRANHYFADTSFNRDIISLDEDTFVELIKLLVPNKKQKEVRDKLTKLLDKKERRKKKEIPELLKKLVSEVFVSLSVEDLKRIVACLII